MTEAELLALAEAAAKAAGEVIMPIYRGAFTVETKADGSPLTQADRAADAVIQRILAVSNLPILSEEAEAPLLGRRWWCVDPLDGTKEFVARTDEFTVGIALIDDGRPVLGVLHCPPRGGVYAGRVGTGATCDGRAIRCRPRPSAPLALVSRSHRDGAELDAALAANAVGESRIVGSALKFGLIAAGEGDLYIRLGPTSEWDTAAGQAVLEAAGGSVTDLAGAPLRYGKPAFLNPGFVARGTAV